MSDTDYKRFDDLILRHSGLIKGLCLRRSEGNPDLCADLMQECYIHLWLHFATLRPAATPLQQSFWIYWRCRSLFSHLARRQNPLQLVPFSQLLAPSLLHSAVDPDADSDALAGQQRDLIRSLARDLTPREQQALELMLQDCPTDEMAHLLNINQRSAIALRHRVISKLRQCYHAQYPRSNSNQQ